MKSTNFEPIFYTGRVVVMFSFEDISVFKGKRPNYYQQAPKKFTDWWSECFYRKRVLDINLGLTKRTEY